MSKRTGAAGLVLKRTKKIPAEDGTAFGPIAERFRRAGVTPTSALRLAEADLVLGSMKGNLQSTLEEYGRLLDSNDG